MDVYITSGDGTHSSWAKLGTITHPDENTYTWNNQTLKSGQMIDLPEHTTGISLRQTGSQYQVDLGMKLTFQLNPSDHMKEIMKNPSLVTLNNIGSGYCALVGQNPSLSGTQSTDPKQSSLNPTVIKMVNELDTERFGYSVCHDSGSQMLMDYYSQSLENKYLRGLNNNTSEKRFEISYELNEFDTLVGEGNVAQQFAIDKGLIYEQTKGTFYDLLPKGLTVNSASIVARGIDNTIYPHTLKRIPDWENSGQTMLVIHVEKPAKAKNFKIQGFNMNTGIHVNYTAYDSWENILDNGRDLTNSYVYVSEDGPLYSGEKTIRPRTTGDVDRKYYGNIPDLLNNKVNNKLYADTFVSITQPIASLYGFSKEVRAATDDSYSQSASVTPNQQYEYKVRYASSTDQSTGNVVMYDFLEQVDGMGSDWKGTFKRVDTSELAAKGAKPIVYYTTQKNLKVKAEDAADNPVFDLTNTSLWSTTEPDDPATVTGIAIDASQKPDGTPFLFAKGQGAQVVIYMQAPKAPAGGQTRNAAFLKASPDGSDQKTNVEMSNPVTVTLKAPDVVLSKSSNPVSGTEASPAQVQVGDTITYTLNVTNEDPDCQADTIVINDTFDDALKIDPSQIHYTMYSSALDTKGTSIDDKVTGKMDGQTLRTMIPQLSPGAHVVITIPAKIDENLKLDEQARKYIIKNQAVLVEADGTPINHPSETTWHEVSEAQATIQARKILAPIGQDTSSQTSRPVKAGEFSFTLSSVQKDQENDGQKNDGQKEEKEIETITNDANGDVVFSPLTFTKAGTYTYSIWENAGNETGMVYDQTKYSVTISVTNTDNGLTAKIQKQNTPIVFINHYQPEKTTAAITFQKKLFRQGQNQSLPTDRQLKDREFSFTLFDEAGNVVSTASNQADGTIAFDPIAFTKAGTYSYTVKEVQGKEAGITYDSTEYPVTITVTDNRGQLEAKVNYPTQTAFMNYYNPEPVQTAFQFQKQLLCSSPSQDRQLKDQEFSFILYDQDGKELETVANDAQGKISFAPVSFSEAGDYTYTVREIAGTEKGMSYDSNEYPIAVHVTDQAGELEANVEYPQGQLITNTYSKPKPKAAKVNLRFTKQLLPLDQSKSLPTDRQVKENEFSFTLFDQDGKEIATANNDASGAILFNALEFDQAGTYTDTLKEDPGNEPGMKYDVNGCPVKIVVFDDDGQLEAHVIYPEGQTMTNFYQSKEVQASITFKKQLVCADTTDSLPDDREMKDKEFSFVLFDENGQQIAAATNTADGTILFDLPDSFTQVGDYKYTVREVQGSEEEITYDSHSYPVTVHVSDQAGQLKADVDYPDGQTITNKYTPLNPQTAEVSLTFYKKLLPEEKDQPADRPLQNAEFSFVLKDSQGKEIETAVNDADGKIAFAPVSFDQPGDYVYTVSEVNDGQHDITYDSTAYTVTIHVTQDGKTLMATPEGDQKTFTNTYSPAVLAKAQIRFQKVLLPEDTKQDLQDISLKANQFVFGLHDANGKLIASAPNDAKGQVVFKELSFTKPGTYTYTVKEANLKQKGIIYDETEYPVTISVEQTGKDSKTLEATVSYPEGNVVTNKYTIPPVVKTEPISIKGQKIFKNGTLSKDQFTFHLEGEGLDLKTTNDQDGSFEFTLPPYEKTGTYTYIIEEVNDSQKEVEYDTTLYQVRVKVTKKLDGTLQAAVTLHPSDLFGLFFLPAEKVDQVTFTNTQKTTPTPEEPREPASHTTTPDTPTNPTSTSPKLTTKPVVVNKAAQNSTSENRTSIDTKSTSNKKTQNSVATAAKTSAGHWAEMMGGAFGLMAFSAILERKMRKSSEKQH